MAAFQVKNLWSVFITALFALLASVGLTTAAGAAQQPAVRTPGRLDLPKQARPQGLWATVPAPSTRWSPTARGRSLPPTIKQRIRAEAHGSSPATRQRPEIDAESVLSTASTPGANPALAAV
ncbi:hypothetical protein J7E87_12670 [Streptomyces sp. ISL-1]|uniref:DUF6344 domain-containing protein n=1 Tax=Streptomyces sp. ISL-1 TaxID=2817657 RepID=UPI001BE8D51E|nr:DUF6344 domain-containing protein [Streptomyces sp. ISL-1]MBT2390258.1 hypothetical protein [Streptomyces sp. ISL-1]